MKPSTLLLVTTVGLIASTLILSLLPVPRSCIFYVCLLWGFLRSITILAALQQSYTINRTRAAIFFGLACLLSIISSWFMSKNILLSLTDIYGSLFFLLLFVFSLNIKEKITNPNVIRTRQNYFFTAVIITGIIVTHILVNVFPDLQTDNVDKPVISVLLFILLLRAVNPWLREKHTLSSLRTHITSSVLHKKQIYQMSLIMLTVILLLVTLTESFQYVSSQLPFYEGLLVWFSTWKETPIQLFFGTSPSEYAISFYKFHSIGFNDTVYWNMMIEYASSFIAQIGTTTGLLGLIAFTIGLFYSYAHQHNSAISKVAVFLLGISLLVSPPSLMIIPLIALLTQYSVTKDILFLPQLKQGISIIGVLVAISIAGFVILLSLADILYYSSISVLRQGKGMQALDIITQALDIVPFKPHYYVVSSRIYQDASLMLTESDRQYNLNDYWQLSITSAKKATEIAPENPQTWEHLGQIYSMFSSSNPSVAVWQLAAYQQAIKQNPHSPMLFISLGDVYADQGNNNEARLAYEEAIRLKENYTTGYYRLALHHELQQNWRDSLQYYTNVYRLLNPNSPEKTLIEEKIEELQYFLSEPSKRYDNFPPLQEN